MSSKVFSSICFIDDGINNNPFKFEQPENDPFFIIRVEFGIINMNQLYYYIYKMQIHRYIQDDLAMKKFHSN